MSLINQMLKDLEKRSQSAASAKTDFSGLLVSQTALKTSSSTNRIVGLIVILAMLSFVFIVVNKYKLFSPPLKRPIVIAEAHAKAPSPPPPKLEGVNHFVEPPVVMTGITLQSQGPMTTMRFLLDKEALYHLSHDAQNNVILVLENTRLVANVPSMNQITQFVKQFDMVNGDDGNLKMVLSLAPTTQLTHVALSSDGKLPELQIDLLDHPANVAENVAENVAPTTVAQTAPIKTIHTDLDIDRQYHEALKYISQKHYSEAITVLSELLTTYPEFMPARESLAKLLLEQGDHENAEAVIAEGLRLKPHDPAYLMLQARAFMATGHLQSALQVLLESPPAIQADPDYYAFIAALYQRLGKSNLAVPLYEQLLTEQPTNGTWWMGLGIALENTGKSNQAIEAYQKANSNNLSTDLRSYVESRLHALA